MLISFSGIDCAGKSTQIALLRAALERDGHEVEVVWHRPGYSPELVKAKSLVRRIRPSVLPTSAEPRERAAAFSRAFVRQSFVKLSLLDTAFQYGVKIRAKSRALGRTVICDRYVDDAIIDLALRFPTEAVRGSAIERLVRQAVPVPAAAILLTLPYEIMLKRIAEKNEPFPDEPDVRDARYAEYTSLAAAGRHFVVESTGGPAEVHARILEHVRATMKQVRA